ncbi:MFS transporter [Mycetocola reblochoni]|uniref:Transporter, putative n=1 Tax=Mycetocola reblochoni REB411 TaxID=1255698 RepID=A0A1R4JRS0_9MICO|nr:MFS transporter [Mycetocola reblochoni]SJN34696.1 transporter, putative [Mycetocola reblochoni REB411]
MTASPAAQQTIQATQIPLVLGSVLLVYLAQMTLNPIIAPLSREVGLAEWQIGATISTAAVMVVITSQAWGRRSQSRGRKPVLVSAFALATLTMLLFSVVAWAGMAGMITGTALFVLFLLLRGIGFGAAIAAVPPTAQAYIADDAPDEKSRVKGMAGVGAVQGVAMVGGSVLGGVLSAFGLLTPLLVIPVLLGAGMLLLILRLRREPRHDLVASPVRVRPTDRRVWPFLVAGFGMFTSLGFIQVIVGFIVQDRLGLDASLTGVVTGGALFAAGAGMIVAQAVIVPLSGWSPATLLRVGGGDGGVRVPAADRRCRGGAAVRVHSADRPRHGTGDARLHRRADPARRSRRAGRPRRPHQRHDGADVRGRTHGGDCALRRLAPSARHHRRRDHGGDHGVRVHASAIPVSAIVRVTRLRFELLRTDGRSPQCSS